MTKEETIHFANCLKNNWTIDFNDMADFCDTVITELNRRTPTVKEKMKIKNCPFCGGEAYYYMSPGILDCLDNEHIIVCTTCNLRMKDNSGISISDEETEKFRKQVKEELIDRWNTRV